jgi:glycerophosphoryl diester phosphodiesterase
LTAARPAVPGPHPRPLLLAHRGDWTNAAENSLEAFSAAERRPGVDGVELDVWAAGDGTPVVIHDPDLRRVQGIDGEVAQLTAPELAALGVPDLAAVLGVLRASSFVDVELKEDVASRVVELLARVRGDPPRSIVISSFLPGAIAAVRTLAPGWPTWLLHERLDGRVVETALALGCRGVAIEWPALTQPMVAVVREAGLQLMAWTVSDRSALRGVMRFSPDAICLDPPSLP